MFFASLALKEAKKNEHDAIGSYFMPKKLKYIIKKTYVLDL